jgi:hypothetical protein
MPTKWFAQKEQITRTFGSILLFAIILVGIVFVGRALSAMPYLILYLTVTLAVLLGIVWAPHVSRSFGIAAVILAALVAIGYFWPSEKASENSPQEKKQQEAKNEQRRTHCQYEQEQWSIESASQIEISDPSLTGIGNSDYNISALVKNKSQSEVTGLRLSITARDCPTLDAQVADCDIFGRVETFETDIPAGEVRQINGKITIRGVEKPRYVVSPKFAVNDVRAPPDDALANRLLSERLSSGSLRSGSLRCE